MKQSLSLRNFGHQIKPGRFNQDFTSDEEQESDAESSDDPDFKGGRKYESYRWKQSSALKRRKSKPKDTEKEQVWSLSSFKVSRQLLTNDLNEVLSFSLLMTSLTALTNKGLFLAAHNLVPQ